MSEIFQLSGQGLEFVKNELVRYEQPESAIIPCLYMAQKENGGHITDEVIEALGVAMDLPTSKINEVFQFYTMFNQKPVGHHHVQVCNNISCALNGSRELTDHICQQLKTKVGKMTEDGQFTVSRVECLGSCGTAPMMQVNDTYYENLNHESAMKVLRDLKG